MKSGDRPRNARQYVERLAAAGRYSFTPREAQTTLGVSAAAAMLALNRLSKQGLVALPTRGFYVIVPPEYRSLGCLPAEQFIPSLMQQLKLPYYVGLLSAAEFHGAAHLRPQALQVFLEKTRRPIACGKVGAVFMVRKRLREVPVQTINTPRGALVISTPEATALDLVGYERQTGGLNLVATVLSELAEKIDPQKLAQAAAAAPVTWAQRLGYLLERVGARDKTAELKSYVQARAQESTLLVPGAPHKTAKRSATWKLFVNVHVKTAS